MDRENKLKYIFNQIDNLEYKDRIKILRNLRDEGLKIHQHADGCRINLTDVPTYIIKDLYEFILLKITTNNKIHYISD